LRVNDKGGSFVMLTSTSQLFSSSFFIAINQGYRSKELEVPFQASKNSSTYLKFFAHIVAQARPVVVRCSLKPRSWVG